MCLPTTISSSNLALIPSHSFSLFAPKLSFQLINRFKYANHVYRREQFVAKRSNQVHFDPSLATSTTTSANEQTRQSADKKRVSPDEQTNIANRANQSKIQLNPTDLSHISYSLGSANADHSTPFESGALHGALNGGRSEKTSNRPHADNWPSNIDFRSLLSGAELRNLDLLQLLNDPSVRDWLTETIYPDHVGYGATAGIQS